ncbi:sulfatase-like hydrolase/transferase [Marinicella rhabdoformis]|uniref:sulfatase-like hydrolase/transferase n=1 Tax=Marinicella rhabdoformis TaxID=2580566 RepID=UPI0012AEC06F|nr:sulfatase-like hydrolase/transferase [Marinicella rhabdoformis]
MNLSKKQLVLSTSLSLLFLAFVITVYTPHLIFFSQTEYFNNDFWSLVTSNFLKALVFCIISAAVLSLFPLVVLRLISPVIFVLSILIWLQVDFFAVSYGVLDGSDLDFALFDSRGYLELLILFLSVLMAIFFRNWLSNNNVFILTILLLGLSCSVVYKSVITPVSAPYSENIDAEFNQYSASKNIIVIVLDGFGAEYFQRIIKSNPELKTDFEGFVSYSDAISNYAATVGSIPSMLVGEMYPLNVKYKTFISENVANNGMPKIFEQLGYLVSFISPSLNFKSIYPDRFLSDVTADKEMLKKYNSYKLLDYSLFRASLHQFKSYIYGQGQWMLSQELALQSSLPNTYSERGKVFLDYVTSQATVSGKTPRYKIIHATIPHPEFVYDSSCNRRKPGKKVGSDEKMLEQSECALKLLSDLFKKYKSIGVYDNSLIVVTSDHGARVYDNPENTGFPSDFELSASGILFMIKGQGQNSSFKEVKQPFSLLKLKENIINEAMHDSDFSQMVDVDRMFYAYQPIQKSAEGYLNDAPVYLVDADYTDPSSWKLQGFYTNNCLKQSLPIHMTFGRANRSGYCGAFGFQQYGKSFQGIWTKYLDSRIIFGLDSSGFDEKQKSKISFRLKPRIDYESDEVLLHVNINGIRVGSIVLKENKMQTVNFTFDSSVWHSGQNELQLLMPEVKSGKEKGVNKVKHKLGVYIEKIVIDQ